MIPSGRRPIDGDCRAFSCSSIFDASHARSKVTVQTGKQKSKMVTTSYYSVQTLRVFLFEAELQNLLNRP